MVQYVYPLKGKIVYIMHLSLSYQTLEKGTRRPFHPSSGMTKTKGNIHCDIGVRKLNGQRTRCSISQFQSTFEISPLCKISYDTSTEYLPIHI